MKIFDFALRGLIRKCSIKPMSRSGNYCSTYTTTRRLSNSVKLNENDDILPVLIVGAGPVGLVLSILLTNLGVRCAVLEKNNTFSKHPQAHFINNRSMEVFRKVDGLSEDILRSQPPVDLWRKFIYCTSLSGSILGSVDHIQPQDLEQVVSPVTVAHFSQYKLVNLLLKKLENLDFFVRTCESNGFTGCISEKEILMGHECVSVDATEHYLNVMTSVQNIGKCINRNIRCRFLVGTDGARSTVRKLTGIAMKGEKDMQKLVSVHFLSQDLGKYLLKERPGMLFFIFNTEAIGVLVAHDLKQGEFVLQVPFYPPQQKLEDFSREMCEKLIFKFVGRKLEDINVVDIKPWVMHAEVAERFLSFDDRVILAGDAAHCFPPAGGFGMNTGIQDAHNLAWKLAYVVNGIAPFKLLKTYEAERKPIAIYNTELSVKNFVAAMEVPSALGLNPSVANSVHHVINDGPASILPSGLQRVLLDGIFSLGRAQLSDNILNERNPLGYSRLKRLRHIFEEGKSLQLQFPAEDLGFRYLEGALVPDSHSVHCAPEPPTGRRRDYIPSAEPGSRLPHMKVRKLKAQESMSTLDLVSGDKAEFILITAPFKASYDLALAALKVAKKFKISIKVCVIWPADTANRYEVGTNEAPLAIKNCIDIVEVKSSSATSSWWDICQMSEKGALLVRPDEHIAWRSKSEIVGDPMLEMEKAISSVLGV